MIPEAKTRSAAKKYIPRLRPPTTDLTLPDQSRPATFAPGTGRRACAKDSARKTLSRGKFLWTLAGQYERPTLTHRAQTTRRSVQSPGPPLCAKLKRQLKPLLLIGCRFLNSHRH